MCEFNKELVQHENQIVLPGFEVRLMDKLSFPLPWHKHSQGGRGEPSPSSWSTPFQSPFLNIETITQVSHFTGTTPDRHATLQRRVNKTVLPQPEC